MNGEIRIEIVGRDAFWRNAVFVEWEHQYPERKLLDHCNHCYLIKTDWLVDLKRVAEGCFSKIVVAPENLGRRLWLRQFIRSQSNNQT